MAPTQTEYRRTYVHTRTLEVKEVQLARDSLRSRGLADPHKNVQLPWDLQI